MVKFDAKGVQGYYMAKENKKIYILDTSVLVYDSEAIETFQQTNIGIPITVIEELDRFKSETSERGAAAREVIRFLDAVRLKGSLKDGVQLDNESLLYILFIPGALPSIPEGLYQNTADNKILLMTLAMKDLGYHVHLISKDLNMRVKADALGIHAEDYLKGQVSKEKIYKGWVRLEVPAIQLKKDFPDELYKYSQHNELLPNEFIHVVSRNNEYNYKIFRYLGDDQFKHVLPPAFKWPLEARNPQQLMALDLLMDPAIQMVSLIGPAGTGKTFLALLAGLHQILVEHEYKKLLISRPVIPLGPDIGYLPGTIEEKLHSWMQPMYDNMYFITQAANIRRQLYDVEQEYGLKKGKKKLHRPEGRTLESLDQLIKEGKISLEAITYMRGRSIPFQYILLDEVQNLTPHEVKTLISRVGEGSKIILVGDPYQIDAVYLDFSSNGLVVASNKFKGQRLFGTVFLETSERSELSQLVSKLL